jgi:cytochrome c peroxidase
MKDREKSIANGLILYENPEELCITCHNAESPTYVDFDFAENWEKIKHNVPE